MCLNKQLTKHACTVSVRFPFDPHRLQVRQPQIGERSLALAVNVIALPELPAAWTLARRRLDPACCRLD